MFEHSLCEGMQSAYKAGHSTETALVRVKNDILTSVDKNQCVLLVLLDLSAAFDTVNHSTLLRVLQHRIGLGGTALMWCESYLRERTQAVAIRYSTVPSVELQRGVPQGSVLRPILFTIYTLARVRTGPGKPGKSWNLIIWIPGLESHGILAQVLESHGISCWQIYMQQSCLLFWIVWPLCGKKH